MITLRVLLEKFVMVRRSSGRGGGTARVLPRRPHRQLHVSWTARRMRPSSWRTRAYLQASPSRTRSDIAYLSQVIDSTSLDEAARARYRRVSSCNGCHRYPEADGRFEGGEALGPHIFLLRRSSFVNQGIAIIILLQLTCLFHLPQIVVYLRIEGL